MHNRTTADFRTRLEQCSAALAGIGEALDGARFSAASDGGQVVATADQDGRLVSLEFVDVAMTRVPVAELGRQVVAAVNQAQAQAEQAFLGMVVDRLGPPSRATEGEARR